MPKLTKREKEHYCQWIRNLRGNQPRIALLYLVERIGEKLLQEAIERASCYTPDSELISF